VSPFDDGRFAARAKAPIIAKNPMAPIAISLPRIHLNNALKEPPL